MDNSAECNILQLEAVAPSKPQQLTINECHQLSLRTPDVTNIEFSKRISLLELENGRLRNDLKNAQIELNAQVAANQGLKLKIAELYVEIQSILQEKQTLRNDLSDIKNCLSVSKSSIQFYQNQVHSLQASKKTFETEVETYRGILKQRQKALVNVTSKYKQSNEEYTSIIDKYQEERRALREEIENLRSRGSSIADSTSEHDGSLFQEESACFSETSTKLETVEEELSKVKEELKTVEQKLLRSENSRVSMEDIIGKQSMLIASTEEKVQKSEYEKNRKLDQLKNSLVELEKLRSENKDLKTSLLSSTNEQSQIEDAIYHLESQLSKMIDKYKSLKAKNADYEEKLMYMQRELLENKKEKTLSTEGNGTLLRRLRQERNGTKNMQTKSQEGKIGERDTDIKGELKSLTKGFDESIDEGYGDCSISIDIPNVLPVNPVLLNSAYNVLLRSKDLFAPIQAEVNKLQSKMESLNREEVTACHRNGITSCKDDIKISPYHC